MPAFLAVRHSDGYITGCRVQYSYAPHHMKAAIKKYVRRHTLTGLVMLITQAQKTLCIQAFNKKGIPTLMNDHGIKSGHTIDWYGPMNIAPEYRYLVDYETGLYRCEARHIVWGVGCPNKCSWILKWEEAVE